MGAGIMYRVGIIGCGKLRTVQGATGFGMSRAHAGGYIKSPDAQITALADINLENAQAFQADYGGERIYADYRQMLAEENLDIISISTWPQLHAEMVIAAAEAGVKAVHCEKPMASTYGEAVRMVEACEANGVQLTINHQRRFGAPFRMARELVQQGAIGDLTRIEAMCDNLYDWGTHWFDMMFFYLNQTPAEWVIGQVDARNGKTIFGVQTDGQGLSYVQFANGVHGLMITGTGAGGLMNRLIGTEGVIEVGYSAEVPLRIRSREDAGWRVIETGEGIHGVPEYVERGVLDLIDALKTGREPELAGPRGLQATELIFATYESSRRRGRVDLPLMIEDSPFLSMLAVGELETDR
jgi:UDP-N-acetylglucosamine 3-dehydrogenase